MMNESERSDERKIVKADMRLLTPADLSEAAIEDAVAVLGGLGEKPRALITCNEMSYAAGAAALAAQFSLELIELPPAMLKWRDSWAVWGTKTAVWSEGA